MHSKYTTSGLILTRENHGESNSYFSVFTREFGKVFASAQAVREVRSKLRMNLQSLSFAEISLIRGRSVWKIISSNKTSSLYEIFKTEKQKLLVSANIFALLSRLLHGEEKNEPLFDLLSDAFLYFEKNDLTSEETKNFETILVLNILHLLGYVGNKEEFNEFLEKKEWNGVLLAKMEGKKAKALFEINRSLMESQL